MTSRGALLVIEGLDRSGKSTQAKKLLEYLKSNGRHVELWKFPDRSTRIGHVIDEYLQRKVEVSDETIHLLFSANRWERKKEMEQLLLSGTNLILDRYAYSGVAYTAAKGLDLTWCKSPDVGLPLPDAVFFLDIPNGSANDRQGFGDERYEKNEIQQEVRKCFLRLKDSKWQIFNADKSIEVLHSELREAAEKTIDGIQNGLIGELWANKASEASLSNGHAE